MASFFSPTSRQPMLIVGAISIALASLVVIADRPQQYQEFSAAKRRAGTQPTLNVGLTRRANELEAKLTSIEESIVILETRVGISSTNGDDLPVSALTTAASDQSTTSGAAELSDPSGQTVDVSATKSVDDQAGSLQKMTEEGEEVDNTADAAGGDNAISATSEASRDPEKKASVVDVVTTSNAPAALGTVAEADQADPDNEEHAEELREQNQVFDQKGNENDNESSDVGQLAEEKDVSSNGGKARGSADGDGGAATEPTTEVTKEVDDGTGTTRTTGEDAAQADEDTVDLKNTDPEGHSDSLAAEVKLDVVEDPDVDVTDAQRTQPVPEATVINQNQVPLVTVETPVADNNIESPTATQDEKNAAPLGNKLAAPNSLVEITMHHQALPEPAQFPHGLVALAPQVDAEEKLIVSLLNRLDVLEHLYNPTLFQDQLKFQAAPKEKGLLQRLTIIEVEVGKVKNRIKELYDLYYGTR